MHKPGDIIIKNGEEYLITSRIVSEFLLVKPEDVIRIDVVKANNEYKKKVSK